MAHYLADLITKAESGSGEEKPSAQKNCFDTILTLWKYRAELPNGKRPFEELEPVVRAIESLDPDDETRRYFSAVQTPAGDKKENPEAEAWLKMVDGLDFSAKVLIRHCLAEAARAAIDSSENWVKLAEAAGANSGVTGIVLNFVSSTGRPDLKPDLAAKRRQLEEDRLARLKSFVKLAEVVVSEWSQNLAPSSASRTTQRPKEKSPRSARKRTGPSSG